MLNPAGLLPHAGTMCLLEAVLSWDATAILCSARSHLDPANPLRRAGRLGIVCAAEYAMQAAAVHGALLAGGLASPGLAAALRNVRFGADRLDDPAHGILSVRAVLQNRAQAGSLYDIEVHAEHGTPLLTGRVTIVTPQSAA